MVRRPLPHVIENRIRAGAAMLRQVDRRFARRTINRNVGLAYRRRRFVQAVARLEHLVIDVQLADLVNEAIAGVERPSPQRVAALRSSLRNLRYNPRVRGHRPLTDLNTILLFRYNIR